ncbi:eukaryotic translation initiation factor 2-alpha kinase-like [Ischnura elegans]|uniref:eukaryotic translation initiation factor 2-alpha kinase-like n=1 Tax=Ischnura elegans TaxID=197161 RepID=UPI001ED893F5|nr:eukaryotic translation initiation factor 2-alpha kinase-like [Ischnura elegans]
MGRYFIKIIMVLCYLSALEVYTLHQDESVRNFEELPYCDPSISGWKHKDPKLVLVSTLDGKLSAINVEGGGEVSWSVDTGPGSMLSSSIHQLELTNNGHWARMIPSLTGGLYNFNGDSVEAIPVNADDLLQSDFRYSDGSVISGGKESRTYGIVAHSGKVIYECSMEGCVNLTDGMNLKDDENNILVLRRQTQTVRAVEPSTGVERWNFSVSQHDVKFLKDHSPECHGDKGSSKEKSEDFELKVVIPDGVVCAVSKEIPDKIIWKHKFTAPVVHAWQLDDGHMNAVDLFSTSAMTPYHHGESMPPLTEHPLFYLGMHNKQLYIQESAELQSLLKHQSVKAIESTKNFLRIPWKPFPASKNAVEIIGPKNSKDDTALQPIESSPAYSTTALSVLYASEYINGNGFFLYTNVEKKAQDHNLCPDDGEDTNHSIHSSSNISDIFNYDPEDEMPVQIIGSLWFWWKEVLAISLATAIFVNLFITQRFVRILKFRRAQHLGHQFQPLPDHCWPVDKILCLGTTKDSGIDLNQSKKDSSNSTSIEVKGMFRPPEFISRYLTDFEPMHRLGKGGFGVVFEARNKIDDCSYAIKRIPLPNRQNSRDRVMREVKALAKLDHQNIVRYFNAWLECPPPGWQEEQDKAWNDSDIQSDSHFSLTPKDATSIDLSENSNAHLKILNQMKPPSVSPLTNSLESASDASIWLNMSNGASTDTATKSISLVDDSDEGNCEIECEESDSFIVFANGSKGDACSSNQANGEISKSLAFGNTKEPLFTSNCLPESNLKQVIVVKKSKDMCEAGPKSITVDEHPKSRKRRKKNVEARELVPKKDLRQEDSFASSSSRVYLYIQMQLCRKESLREWLRDDTSHLSDRKQCLLIFDQIVQAVEYVHLRGLIHRDLKPSNIFFSQEGQVKVGDFGLVTAMVEAIDPGMLIGNESGMDSTKCQRHTAQVGTHLYMSPEQLMGKPYNYKVDIYSLGLIFFELLVPFSTQMERWRTLKDLRENKFPTNFHIEHPAEFQLLNLMLSKNPDDRPTTFGIRSRPPLLEMQDASINEVSKTLYYHLPVRKDSSSGSLSQSS